MASPPKPWERGPGGLRLVSSNRCIPFQPDLGFTSSQNTGGGGTPSQDGRPTLPPLPPRPNTSMQSTSMSRPYYSSFNSTPYGYYGGGSVYGGYGNFGGYNRYGMMGSGLPDENGFIQIAEDSSRQAFQSIENIVHAFGSVSMMLESTYHAVYSSFRAVLGVAEHFSRMKSHFVQIFSALAVLRTLKWIMRKLLYLIGLRSQDPSLEAAWRNTVDSRGVASSLTEADLKQSKSSWPIVMFFAVVFGGPYLIMRLWSSLIPSASSQKSNEWKKGIGEHYAAVALYSFQAGTKKELSFQSGQNLFLAPKNLQPHVRGWLWASNGKENGLVPFNYLRILGLKQGVANSSVTEVKVAPGIPSLRIENQREKLSMPGAARNLDLDQFKNLSSDTLASISGQPEVSKQEDLQDTDISGQPMFFDDKIENPDLQINSNGPDRSAFSLHKEESSCPPPDLELPEKFVGDELDELDKLDDKAT